MISLEYLAGVLDVAGSMTITQRRDREGPKVLLQIQSENKRLPELFAERFGGAVSMSVVSSGKRWAWQRQGKSVQEVLRQLRPHMHCRLDRVDKILDMQLKNRGGSRPRSAKPIVDDESQRVAA